MPTGIYVRSEEHKANMSASSKGKKKSEEHKAKISASGKIAMNRPEVKAKAVASGKIAMNRPEVKAKISTSISKEKNPSWKGGFSGYYHGKARELFGAPICQDCGITLEEYSLTHKHKQFQMHCVSKNFTILEQWNWKCLCSRCHHKTYIHRS